MADNLLREYYGCGASGMLFTLSSLHSCYLFVHLFLQTRAVCSVVGKEEGKILEDKEKNYL